MVDLDPLLMTMEQLEAAKCKLMLQKQKIQLEIELIDLEQQQLQIRDSLKPTVIDLEHSTTPLQPPTGVDASISDRTQVDQHDPAKDFALVDARLRHEEIQSTDEPGSVEREQKLGARPFVILKLDSAAKFLAFTSMHGYPLESQRCRHKQARIATLDTKPPAGVGCPSGFDASIFKERLEGIQATPTGSNNELLENEHTVTQSRSPPMPVITPAPQTAKVYPCTQVLNSHVPLAVLPNPSPSVPNMVSKAEECEYHTKSVAAASPASEKQLLHLQTPPPHESRWALPYPECQSMFPPAPRMSETTTQCTGTPPKRSPQRSTQACGHKVQRPASVPSPVAIQLLNIDATHQAGQEKVMRYQPLTRLETLRPSIRTKTGPPDQVCEVTPRGQSSVSVSASRSASIQPGASSPQLLGRVSTLQSQSHLQQGPRLYWPKVSNINVHQHEIQLQQQTRPNTFRSSDTLTCPVQRQIALAPPQEVSFGQGMTRKPRGPSVQLAADVRNSKRRSRSDDSIEILEERAAQKPKINAFAASCERVDNVADKKIKMEAQSVMSSHGSKYGMTALKDVHRKDQKISSNRSPYSNRKYSRRSTSTPASINEVSSSDNPSQTDSPRAKRPSRPAQGTYRVGEFKRLAPGERSALELRYCAHVAKIIAGKPCIDDPPLPLNGENLWTRMRRRFSREPNADGSDQVSHCYQNAQDFEQDVKGMLQDYIRMGACENCPFAKTGNSRVMCWRVRLESVLDDKMRGLKRCLRECEEGFVADDVKGRRGCVDGWFEEGGEGYEAPE